MQSAGFGQAENSEASAPQSNTPVNTRKRPFTTPIPVALTSPSLDPRFVRLVTILNELEELCALGVVDIAMPRRGMAGIDAPDGWLWLETPSRRIEGETVEAWMESLIDNGHLRATYVMLSPTTARVRLYLLPEDVGVGGGLIREMSSAFRKNLKNLLKSVDTSTTAWHGGQSQENERNPIFNQSSKETQEFVSPTNEVYGFDPQNTKFYRDPAYPESIRRSRYTFRQK